MTKGYLMGIGNLHIAIGFLQLKIPTFSLWTIALLALYAVLTAPFMFHPACTRDNPHHHNKAYTTIFYLAGLVALFIYVGLMNLNLTHVGYPTVVSSPYAMLPQIIPAEPGGIILLFIVFISYLAIFDNLFAESIYGKKPKSLCISTLLGLIPGLMLLILILLYEGLNTLHFYYYLLGLFVLYIFIKYRNKLLGKILLFLGVSITFITLFLPAVILPMGGLPMLLTHRIIYQTIFIIIPLLLLAIYLWRGYHYKKLNTYLGVIGLFGLTSMALFIYLYQNNFTYIYSFVFYAAIVSIVYLIWRWSFSYFDGKSDMSHATKSLLATWLFVIIASFFALEFFNVYPFHRITNTLEQIQVKHMEINH